MGKIRVKSTARVARLAAQAFAKYAPELHSYIERRIRAPSTAPDLTQEIFERFLQIDDADAVRNPQAYLFGIASHVVREARFRDERSLVTYDSEVVDRVGETADSALPDDLAARLILRQDLDRALSQLPPIHRVILLLVKRDGLSYQEAAAKTKLSVATVTSYVFEARAKMKMLLKP